MTWGELILLAIALNVDAIGIALAVGLRWRGPRQIFRLAWHFGLFHTLFPLIGAGLGYLVLDLVQVGGRYLGASIFLLLGARMLYTAWRGVDEARREIDPTRGWSLMGLSAAVSIDAFACGVVFVASQTPLARAVILLGVVTTANTVAAMLLAGKIAGRLGKWADILGGSILLALALRLLLIGHGP